jgi:hypothetical protein
MYANVTLHRRTSQPIYKFAGLLTSFCPDDRQRIGSCAIVSQLLVVDSWRPSTKPAVHLRRVATYKKALRFVDNRAQPVAAFTPVNSLSSSSSSPSQQASGGGLFAQRTQVAGYFFADHLGAQAPDALVSSSSTDAVVEKKKTSECKHLGGERACAPDEVEEHKDCQAARAREDSKLPHRLLDLYDLITSTLDSKTPISHLAEFVVMDGTGFADDSSQQLASPIQGGTGRRREVMDYVCYVIDLPRFSDACKRHAAAEQAYFETPLRSWLVKQAGDQAHEFGVSFEVVLTNAGGTTITMDVPTTGVVATIERDIASVACDANMSFFVNFSTSCGLDADMFFCEEFKARLWMDDTNVGTGGYLVFSQITPDADDDLVLGTNYKFLRVTQEECEVNKTTDGGWLAYTEAVDRDIIHGVDPTTEHASCVPRWRLTGIVAVREPFRQSYAVATGPLSSRRTRIEQFNWCDFLTSTDKLWVDHKFDNLMLLVPTPTKWLVYRFRTMDSAMVTCSPPQRRLVTYELLQKQVYVRDALELQTISGPLLTMNAAEHTIRLNALRRFDMRGEKHYYEGEGFVPYNICLVRGFPRATNGAAHEHLVSLLSSDSGSNHSKTTRCIGAASLSSSSLTTTAAGAPKVACPTALLHVDMLVASKVHPATAAAVSAGEQPQMNFSPLLAEFVLRATGLESKCEAASCRQPQVAMVLVRKLDPFIRTLQSAPLAMDHQYVMQIAELFYLNPDLSANENCARIFQFLAESGSEKESHELLSTGAQHGSRNSMRVRHANLTCLGFVTSALFPQFALMDCISMEEPLQRAMSSLEALTLILARFHRNEFGERGFCNAQNFYWFQGGGRFLFDSVKWFGGAAGVPHFEHLFTRGSRGDPRGRAFRYFMDALPFDPAQVSRDLFHFVDCWFPTMLFDSATMRRPHLRSDLGQVRDPIRNYLSALSFTKLTYGLHAKELQRLSHGALSKPKFEVFCLLGESYAFDHKREMLKEHAARSGTCLGLQSQYVAPFAGTHIIPFARYKRSVTDTSVLLWHSAFDADILQKWEHHSHAALAGSKKATGSTPTNDEGKEEQASVARQSEELPSADVLAGDVPPALLRGARIICTESAVYSPALLEHLYDLIMQCLRDYVQKTNKLRQDEKDWEKKNNGAAEEAASRRQPTLDCVFTLLITYFHNDRATPDRSRSVTKGDPFPTNHHFTLDPIMMRTRDRAGGGALFESKGITQDMLAECPFFMIFLLGEDHWHTRDLDDGASRSSTGQHQHDDKQQPAPMDTSADDDVKLPRTWKTYVSTFNDSCTRLNAAHVPKSALEVMLFWFEELLPLVYPGPVIETAPGLGDCHYFGVTHPSATNPTDIVHTRDMTVVLAEDSCDAFYAQQRSQPGIANQLQRCRLHDDEPTKAEDGSTSAAAARYHSSGTEVCAPSDSSRDEAARAKVIDAEEEKAQGGNAGSKRRKVASIRPAGVVDDNRADKPSSGVSAL